MAKYLALYSFTGETAARFAQNPGDRAGAVQKLAEAVGGRLEAYYWMLGEHDGLAIIEAPDTESMAALAMTVTGTGAFRHFETHELIEAGALQRIAEKARSLQGSYTPPGASS